MFYEGPMFIPYMLLWWRDMIVFGWIGENDVLACNVLIPSRGHQAALGYY